METEMPFISFDRIFPFMLNSIAGRFESKRRLFNAFLNHFQFSQ